MPTRRTALRHTSLVAMFALAGCAAFPGSEPLRVTLAAMTPMPGEGMEVRLRLKLRVQNPDETPVDYQGISVTLDLRGATLATGVSPEAGTIPGFGERVIEVPVTLSAMAALRQVFGFATGADSSRALDYDLRGRLGGGLGGHPFEASGKVDWPAGALP